jgi:hypothetical protein
MSNPATEPEFTFAEPAPMLVADLQPGDFVIDMPAQGGYRAERFGTVGSGITAITAPSYAGGWRAGAYRQRKRPVLSRRMTFIDRAIPPADLPCDWTVTARRLLAGPPPPPSLDEQVAALQRDYDAALADTAADQGEDIVDAGGWAEIARAVAALPGEASPAARAEFLRRHGLPAGSPR